MATINDGELLLHVEGANEEELRRGLLAARASFDASGFTLDEGFEGVFQREGHDIDGTLDKMPRRLFDAANALDTAAYEGAKASRPGADPPAANWYLALWSAFQESERSIDEMGIRHLNSDVGPHFTMERRESVV